MTDFMSFSRRLIVYAAFIACFGLGSGVAALMEHIIRSSAEEQQSEVYRIGVDASIEANAAPTSTQVTTS